MNENVSVNGSAQNLRKRMGMVLSSVIYAHEVAALHKGRVAEMSHAASELTSSDL